MKKKRSVIYDFFNIVPPELNEISVTKKEKYSYLKALILFLGIVIIGITFIQLIYMFDNKYTAQGSQGKEGKLVLNEKDFTEEKLLFLIDGWQLYPQKLLSPQEFKDEVNPPIEVFIGQYPDFSLGNLKDSPMGKGTYVLNLEYTGEPQILRMEIPEILSSAKIWINGNLIETLGNPEEENYISYVKNSVINFTIEANTEIVIEVGNYTHYYSGIYYPPALGSPAAIDAMLFSRLIFYSFLCIFSFSIALFTLFISYFPKRHPLYFFYGMMTLAFSIHVAYPFVRWIGFPFPGFFYRIEDFSWYVMIVSVLAINLFVSGFWHQVKLRRGILTLGIGMSALTIIIPLFILPQHPKLVNWYGIVIDTYFCFVFLFLIFTSIIGMIHEKSHQYLLLAGNTVFGFTLLFKVTSSNLFEPIYGGWQTEYGGFLMIVIFGVLTVKAFKNIILVNRYLTEKLEEEVEIRTEELNTLIKERKELLASITHDIKAPLSSIQSFIDLVKEGNILLDDEIKSYLWAIDQKSCEVQDRVKFLQEFSNETNLKKGTEPILLKQLLNEVYENIEMDANAAGINFILELPEEEIEIKGNKSEIVSVLENIIYNALSFTDLNGMIKISLKAKNKEAEISIEDSGCGISEENIDKIFNPYFSIRNGNINKTRGLGLSLTKECIERHQGKISVKSEIGKGTIFIISIKIE